MKNDLFYPVKRIPNRPLTMVQVKKAEVEYLQFQGLSQIGCIKHVFSTRIGGVSDGMFSSMNLSFTRGDDPDKVFQNFSRIASLFEADCEQFVLSDQTHTDHIHVVTRTDAGNGLTKELPYQDIDGLITNEKGLILSTFYADCVPLYFVDPVHKAIGLCHSGWKGTVFKIGKKTIEAMTREYGTNPADVYAAIAPSICQSCYEVSEDVIIAVNEAFCNVPTSRLSDFYYAKENGKYQLNLHEVCKEAMLEAGVLESHIEMTDICTCCNPDYLFSHRASQGKRGNLGAFLMLCDEEDEKL